MRFESVREKLSTYREFGGAAKEYLKGRLTETIADNLPDVLTNAVYVGFDTFGTIQSSIILRDYILNVINEQLYFDFSTPENTSISVGKIAFTCLSYGFLINTIKKIAGFFVDRGGDY